MTIKVLLFVFFFSFNLMLSFQNPSFCFLNLSGLRFTVLYKTLVQVTDLCLVWLSFLSTRFQTISSPL